MPPALTSLSHGAGCGCKLSAADLRPIVAGLPQPSDPRVLVATATADDAGVVRLTDDLALVQTADFFTCSSLTPACVMKLRRLSTR